MATEMPAKKPETFAMKSRMSGAAYNYAAFPLACKKYRQTAEA
jgi:hypothetical protein